MPPTASIDLDRQNGYANPDEPSARLPSLILTRELGAIFGAFAKEDRKELTGVQKRAIGEQALVAVPKVQYRWEAILTEKRNREEGAAKAARTRAANRADAQAVAAAAAANAQFQHAQQLNAGAAEPIIAPPRNIIRITSDQIQRATAASLRREQALLHEQTRLAGHFEQGDAL